VRFWLVYFSAQQQNGLILTWPTRKMLPKIIQKTISGSEAFDWTDNWSRHGRGSPRKASSGIDQASARTLPWRHRRA